MHRFTSAINSAVGLFLIRGLGVGMSALGGIWVARTLGPEKLGISTFVFGLVNLATLFVSLNQDNNYVRRGLNLPGGESISGLVCQVFSLRLGLVMFLVTACLACLAVIGLDNVLLLPILAGAVLAVIQANDAGWILKLRDRMPMFFVAISVQGMLTGLLCILFIRPDWPAGSDLVFACFGSGAAFLLAWFWACKGEIVIRVTPAHFLQGARLVRDGPWLVVMGLGLYFLTSAEIPLIGALASVEDLGIYRAALQMINVVNPFVPLFFFRLYPRLIELQRDDPLQVLSEQFQAFGLLISVGVPLSIAAFIVAPFVFGLIYSPVFTPAALPFAILFVSKVLAIGVNIFMWGNFARRLDKHVVLLLLCISFLSLCANVILIPKVGILAPPIVSVLAQIMLLGGNLCVMIMSQNRYRIS